MGLVSWGCGAGGDLAGAKLKHRDGVGEGLLLENLAAQGGQAIWSPEILRWSDSGAEMDAETVLSKVLSVGRVSQLPF